MIYFIGDKPSKCNVDPRIAFVGTNSYKILLEWIHRMNLSINNIELYNATTFVDEIQDRIEEDDQIIALGVAASELLLEHNIPHLKIPHPSGLNRSLNDARFVNKFLKECKTYVLQK